MPLSELLMQTRAAVEHELQKLTPPYTLFFSICDGSQRARVQHTTATDFHRAWRAVAAATRKVVKSSRMNVCWLRVDWVSAAERSNWADLKLKLRGTKRTYFRYGIALDPEYRYAFLEQELNANAMIYGGNKISHAVINEKNFRSYARRRYGKQAEMDFSDEKPVWILSTEGVFCDGASAATPLYGPGRNTGRRIIDNLDQSIATRLIQTSSQYLGRQVKRSGRFNYGWHACFDKPIETYNTLRHASSTYAMLEAWEVTGSEKLKSAIDRSLQYLTQNLIKTTELESGEKAAFLVESNGEIKLGGNAVTLLALVKYSELTASDEYLNLMEQLAEGIQFMQDPESGKFVHVLLYPTLTVKEVFRIVYYDGEAAFGLMRLYGFSRNPRWLISVERAFSYFIAAEHWRAHDHWLGYCVNELTIYRPEEKYYQFGIMNVADYLHFVENRITTFPTLLELMMAAHNMVRRLRGEKHLQHLLEQLDLGWFYRALHKRANYLLNGYFWPEMAMYFSNPKKIVGSFFIRHHAFRVRIDDVEHYLSGFVAYRAYLQSGAPAAAAADQDPEEDTFHPIPPESNAPVVAWGGDVNLSRRQHYRTAELGEKVVFGHIPALSNADLSIVNLECVVATVGEQGVPKGENAPYYYRARPEMLRLLSTAHIDVVATANNHSGDYGPEALNEQHRWLDALGIGHTGTGATPEEALTPVIRTAGQLNVALFSIDATQKKFAVSDNAAGCAYLPLKNPAAWKTLLEGRISAARNRAQVVLVAVHWGPNRARRPGADEIAVGHAIIDAGADAVLGASAHVLQGTEVYRQRPIIHDAGDLLFDAIRRSLADSGIFRLEISHRGVERLTFVPVGVGFGFSRQLAKEQAIEVSRRYTRLCKPLGTEMKLIENGCGFIELNPPDRQVCSSTPVAATRYQLDVLTESIFRINGSWQIEAVPEDARIAPLRLGPLTLLGVRLSPAELKSRQLIWVESFWSAEETLTEDYRIDFRASPIEDISLPSYWGKAMDHDPCDWQVPTSRWQPHTIYRDFYGLRPPSAKVLNNIQLQLEVGIVSRTLCIEPIPIDGISVRIAIPANTGKPETRVVPVYNTEFQAPVYQQSAGKTWNAEQLLSVTGGTWLVPPPPGWYVRSVVSGKAFIPESLAPTLFVAHTNNDRSYHEQSTSSSKRRWDLHDTLPGFAHRIAGAIVARPVTGLPPDLPVLQVDDPIKSIIELGLAARSRFSGEVIAITGTAGKSTTLKMLSWILDDKEKILTSLGNYNSRVGAPSMLASLSQDHTAAVIEVAQSALWMKRGPITRWIKPTIALITEIGVSQTSKQIKTVNDTAKWKSRIFDGLTGNSIAIIGEHIECFDYILDKAKRHAKRIIVFGKSVNAEIRITSIQSEERGSLITLKTPVQELDFYIPVPSLGMVHNAVAAISTVYAMGHDLSPIVTLLREFELDESHLQRTHLKISGYSVDIIDDSWNATTSSMLNALSVFSMVKAQGKGRKIAVLGRIVQLGNQSQAIHKSLANPLLNSGVDLVITHGEEMRYLRAEIPGRLLGPHFSSAVDLVNYLSDNVRQSDLILIKGSRRDSDFGSVSRLIFEAEKNSDNYS